MALGLMAICAEFGRVKMQRITARLSLYRSGT